MVASFSRHGSGSNRRRSQRVLLSIPVTVSGDSPQGTFTEQTHTLVVNAHGALITLAAKISQGQQLRLKNQAYAEERNCHVSYIGPTSEGRMQVGIEFIEPAPDFWHIAFPPDDWVPPQVEKVL
jgi:PilZ domain